MTAVLTKPAEGIGFDDIQALISDQVPEGAQIEFKESLPAGKGKSDAWLTGGDGIGDRARNEILEEVVAFANAFGGALVLGVADDRAKPPVAANIAPLPRCADLAARFRQIFGACVDPQLPALEIVPVPTGDDGGVVVFRTGRSRRGPHRVQPTRKCPVRRADRCEELDMREIQDMTLNLARGTERLERLLQERSRRFEEEFKRLGTPEDAFGYRLAAAPVGDEVRFDSLWSDGNLISELRPPAVKVRRAINSRVQELDTIPDLGMGWRPMLRVARTEESRSFNEGIDWFAYAEVHANGLLEYGFVRSRCFKVYGNEREVWLDTDIPVSTLGRLLAWTNSVRQTAHAPGTEYVIDAQFRVTAEKVYVESQRNSPFPGSVFVDQNNTSFPPYTLNGPDENNRLLSRFERDFWNYCGREIGQRQGTLEIVQA